MDYSESLHVSAGIDMCKTNRQGWSTKKVWCLRSVIFKIFFLMLCDGAIFPYIAELTAHAEGISNPQGGQSFGRINEEKSQQMAWGQTVVSWRQVWQYQLAIAAPCYQLQNAAVDVTPQTNRTSSLELSLSCSTWLMQGNLVSEEETFYIALWGLKYYCSPLSVG